MTERHDIIRMIEDLLEALQDADVSSNVTSLIEDALETLEEEIVKEED